LYAIDARSALDANLSDGSSHGSAGLEFRAFTERLDRFIAEDLQGSRISTAQEELGRLGRSLLACLELEQSMREQTDESLRKLVNRFNAEAEHQRRGLEDDKALLDRDIKRLLERIDQKLKTFSQHLPDGTDATLARIAASSPRGQLAQALQDAVQSLVEDSVKEFRNETIPEIEEEWINIADGFRNRTQERVDDARKAASSIFEVPLPNLDVPLLTEQRDRFSFHFVRVEGPTAMLGRSLMRASPDRWARKSALKRAADELQRQLSKHAGRLRWDLSQRMESAQLELEQLMRTELDGSIRAILETADRADSWKQRSNDARRLDEAASAGLWAFSQQLVALGDGGRRPTGC
jgi:hypothetical protein